MEPAGRILERIKIKSVCSEETDTGAVGFLLKGRLHGKIMLQQPFLRWAWCCTDYLCRESRPFGSPDGRSEARLSTDEKHIEFWIGLSEKVSTYDRGISKEYGRTQRAIHEAIVSQKGDACREGHGL